MSVHHSKKNIKIDKNKNLKLGPNKVEKESIKTTQDADSEHKLNKVHENTEYVLSYCAHLESMLNQLQDNYDRLQERQEMILAKLKGDQEEVVSSMQD